MKNIFGKPTINPYLFITGKLAGYCVWTLFFIQFFYNFNTIEANLTVRIVSYLLYISGAIIALVSSFNLGSFTAVGLPDRKTEFKTNGLYKISRNPMYVGFHCMTLAAMLHTMNYAIMVICLCSIIIYHKIILGEEKFLNERFKASYNDYCVKVKRYL